ncbi:MAG: enolase C-terminal domain-like protein [Cyclobacteriaceae bacterium]
MNRKPFIRRSLLGGIGLTAIKTFNREIMCHNARPTLASAAALQFIASTFNAAGIQEYGGRSTEMNLDFYFENELEFNDGFLKVPQLPGLGLIPKEAKMVRILYS